MISVIIPVKDAGPEFASCLDAVRSQDLDEEVEMIAIDSGSRDDSVAVARARGVRVYEIPPEQFTHGGSRNLGADLSRGDVLVFLSQDAIPVDSHWLDHVVHPLREDVGVAGVYGRQLPNEDATPPERYFLEFLYGSAPKRQRAAHERDLSMATTLFSNVNAAMPKAIWERFPFVDDIVMSEDQEWSRRVLLAGYALVYEPAAAVRHSHNYTIVSAFRRFFDSGASSERAYMAGRLHSARVLRRAAISYARGELTWLWRTRQRRWILYSAVYETAKMLGLLAGANHHRFPRRVKRQLSAMPAFWG
jgi:rhamnosyltransferase